MLEDRSSEWLPLRKVNKKGGISKRKSTDSVKGPQQGKIIRRRGEAIYLPEGKSVTTPDWVMAREA